ncbi:MAG TPA: HepT-like ribonuclease domain-containing protein, partial [Pseudogracilibacillus sp.]|nr:HepT-like ribonuclease domain-containing protein [Pseudogracilibacillus sp.]
MYFVDRSKIEKILVYMDELLNEIKDKPFDSKLEKLGLQRSTQMVIESIMDVGNMMIDGFIMRDPG